MSEGSNNADVDEEQTNSVSKIRLSKNEYNATVRNKSENKRLKAINQYINDQSDHRAYKLRTTVHDLKKGFDDNQRVICHSEDFFITRKVQSANPHLRSRAPGTRSTFARPTQDSTQTRAKSASTISRPLTAPLQTLYQEFTDPEETESDDETIPITASRVTSGKRSVDRTTSAVSSSIFSHHSHDFPPENLNISTSSAPSSGQRITWPVKIKVFALQDEDEARQKFLAWRAEQRKTKVRRSSKQFYDLDLEQKYRESVRRRHEIESFVTPELIEEHRLNDPVFAKRYRQLQLAIRAGRIPSYDPNDREIHMTMNKSKIDRARSALINAKETRMKTFHQHQQLINEANLSKRIDDFLKRLAKFKQEQNENDEV